MHSLPQGRLRPLPASEQLNSSLRLVAVLRRSTNQAFLPSRGQDVRFTVRRLIQGRLRNRARHPSAKMPKAMSSQ